MTVTKHWLHISSIFITCFVVMAAAVLEPDHVRAASNEANPMTFAIVRSSKLGCEPNCPQWIAAEGTITGATAVQFEKKLEKLGNLRLPVVINSPGGDMHAAIEMGRMIRKRQLSTGVGITRYEGCNPANKTCKLPKLQKGVYRGIARDESSFCFSACPLVLAGGIERIAGPSALLGVHQARTTYYQEKISYRETYRIVNGKKKLISRKITGRKRIKYYEKIGLDKRLRGILVPYLKQMGISEELLVEMEMAPPSSMNVPVLWKDARMGLITSIFPLVAITGNNNCSPPKNAPNCVLLKP
ncbi:MAG: hypothetical protein WCB71_15815 [Aestuariivirga sp.]